METTERYQFISPSDKVGSLYDRVLQKQVVAWNRSYIVSIMEVPKKQIDTDVNIIMITEVDTSTTMTCISLTSGPLIFIPSRFLDEVCRHFSGN